MGSPIASAPSISGRGPRERLDDRRHQAQAAGVAGVAVTGQPFQVGGQDVVDLVKALGSAS